MKITDLNYDNIDKVAELEKICFGADSWSDNLLREEIGKENKHYYVIMEEEEVLAYGGFAQILDEGHIMNIAVSPMRRRNGFATLILQKFLQSAKDLGINSLTLEVRESNLPARKLYEKNGFSLAGVRKGYYQDKENGCIYWMYLQEE